MLPRSLRKVGVAVSLALLAAGLAVLASHGTRPTEPRRFALSPQECTTECQSRETDCILACEGRVECERACVETSKGCVARCRRPARDAGAPPKVSPPAKPRRRGAGGSPARAPNAGAAGAAR